MSQKAPSPIPPGMHSITPYFTYKGNCTEAIEFYQKCFNAKMDYPAVLTPDRKVLHAMLRIGDSNIMLSDSFRQSDASAGTLLHMWIYTENCDRMFESAVNSGCTVTMPMEDAFWGDRLGQVRDPYGFLWSIATWKTQLSPYEMKKAQDEWLKS